MVPHPEPRSYGRPALGKGRIGLLLDQSGVHKSRSNQVPPDRKTPLHAPFGHEIPAQWTWIEVAVFERRDVGIAEGDIGSGCARDVRAIVRLERGKWDREDARPQLILAETTHRVRTAGVEALSWMENSIAEGCCDTARRGSAPKRTPPADTSVRSYRAAFSHLIECRPVSRRTVVPEIGERECGRVLGAHVGAVSPVRREWIVGAIDRRRESHWREPLVAAERIECRRVADPIVDAEIHIACIDLADLEPVVQARRRAIRQIPRKGQTRSITAINVDAWRAAGVRGSAPCSLVLRGSAPRVP